MIIRSGQLLRFAKDGWGDFLRRMIQHLRGDMADYTINLTDAELIARIESASELAAKYGLLDEVDIAAFIDAGLLLKDPNFPENPRFKPIRLILTDQHLVAEDRAEEMLTLAFQQTL